MLKKPSLNLALLQRLLKITVTVWVQEKLSHRALLLIRKFRPVMRWN